MENRLGRTRVNTKEEMIRPAARKMIKGIKAPIEELVVPFL